MTQASALFEIDPGTGSYGAPGVAQNAAASATINCRLASVSGVYQIEWRITGTHGGNFPALTYSGNPVKQIATFTLPGGLGQAYGIECKVNGGVSPAGDLKTSAVYVLDAAGNRPFFTTETFESDATHGIIPRLNTNVPITGVSVPTNDVVWVDGINGSAGGTAGDLNDPFQTITQGIAAAAALTPTAINPVAILVHPGVYTEAPLTLPAFVTLKSVGGRGTTIIEASTTTSPLVTGSANSCIEGFALTGADGAGGIAILLAVAGSMSILRCKIYDCTTGISATGAGAIVDAREVDITREAGQTLGTAFSCTAAANLKIVDSTAAGVPGTLITEGFKCDGLGSLLTIADCTVVFSVDGVHISNDGTIGAAIGFLNNCTNGIHIAATNGLLSIASMSIFDATTWNILVEGPTAQLITSDLLMFPIPGLISLHATADWDGTWFARDGENSFNVENELRVGSAQRPAEASFGGGDSHTLGMVVKTNTNGTAGAWNDLTTEAASSTGSTFFAFAGTAVDNCLYVGSDISQDALGLKLLCTAAVSGGAIDCEYYNGATWVAFDWMTSLADSPYTTSAKALFAAAVDYQMRFGPQAGAATLLLDGDTKYWMRFRVTSVLTTRPQLEQIKLHSSHFEINREGFNEFFGMARKWRVVNVNSNTFVGIGVSSPTDQDLFVGAVGAVGLENNSFVQNLDRQAGIGIPNPFELDTSHKGRLRINWQPATAAAGNVVWRAVVSTIQSDDLLATSSPGSLTEEIVSAVSAAPGVADQGVVVEMELDFSAIVTSDLTTLSIMIQRQGSSGSDTYGAAAIIRPGGIQLRGLAWADGEPMV
jgi:hypothetical protein